MGIFEDSPEYKERISRPFVPPKINFKDVHDAVPKHLLQKNFFLSCWFIFQNLALCGVMFAFAARIDQMAVSLSQSLFAGQASALQMFALKGGLWFVYQWFQGLLFAGIFCLAHECGHQTLFNSRVANDSVGFVISALIMLPYYAWQITHNQHHKAVGSLERDENFVPRTRQNYKLPPEKRATKTDYSAIFDEAPAMTLWRIFVMQAFGWWAYIGAHVMGSNKYPDAPNFFSPWSSYFKPEQRRLIVINDIGLTVMTSLLVTYAIRTSWTSLFVLWFLPYMICNHWIVMITFLQHSDPSIPHYRGKAWTYFRGALLTVDRPILGSLGRFFFHGLAHDHVAHHLFSSVPFYNYPEITPILRDVLKHDYNYDSTNSFYALYRSFKECTFVEDEGEILFYKNTEGKVAREIDPKAYEQD
ncbi:hypothetical protein BDW22DRAFT_1363881 [Trametopsis cervina]|nr:hypothetical protein BDW22DRAFT_1363881 [Trametopsis cervina]